LCAGLAGFAISRVGWIDPARGELVEVIEAEGKKRSEESQNETFVSDTLRWEAASEAQLKPVMLPQAPASP
jgi:hypothetical protein